MTLSVGLALVRDIQTTCNKYYLIILDSLIHLLSAPERKGIKLEGSNSVSRE